MARGMGMLKMLATMVAAILAVTGLAVTGAAVAAEPQPWQLGLQAPVSPVMEDMHFFHDGILLPVIIAITAFVMILLVFVMVRFNRRANPTPSRTTHNTMVEVVWTVVPVLILVLIAIPSFQLLYKADRVEDADMTIKITGNQWYWTYEYPDHENVRFDSNLVDDADLQPGQLRLLTVDNRLVVPADTNIRLLLTAADVLHSWGVPAFGVKMDTVPGRLNESWMRIERPGVYHGQCYELCGVRHAYMPIQVEVLSQEDFAKWIEEAKVAYGSPRGPQLADARGN